MNSRMLTAALLAASTLTFAACDDDDDNPITPTVQTARVQLINASEIASVDLLVDGTKVGTSATSGTGTGSGCVTVDISKAISVRETGGTTALATLTPGSLDNNGNHTLVLTGGDTPLLQVLDNTSTAPTAGSAGIRLINAAPDLASGGVDVFVTNSGAVIGTTDTPSASNLAFADVSDFFEIPVTAGQAQVFQITANGTTTPVLFSSPDQTFTADQNTTFVLTQTGTGATATFAVVPLTTNTCPAT